MQNNLISRPLHTYNEESLVISGHKLAEWTQLLKQLTEAPQEDIATEFETHFKTLHINGIRVSGGKDNEETHFKTPVNGIWGSREQQRQKLTPFKTPVHILDRDLVKNRSRQTSYKTMGKSGKKNISSQDTVGKVSENLIPFETPNIKHRTSRVHFKTFDDWVKARKMNCDTVLKDVSSFVSEKMEKDWPRATDALTRSYPSRRQPNSQWTKRNGDPPSSRMSPTDREEISMGDYHNRGEFTMEQSRMSPELQKREAASNGQRGKDSKQNCHGSTHFENVSTQKRPKSSKVTEMTHFKTPGQNRGRKWLSGTLTVQWLIEPLNRVTFRDTTCVEAPRALLHLNHSLFITSSSALDTGLAAPLQETSPLAPYKKERLADRKSSRPSTLHAELLWELCEEFVNNLNSVSWHFIKINSFQDPSSSLYGSDSKHIEIDSFQDHHSDLYSKMSQIDSFQDPYILHPNWTHFKTLMFWTQIDSFQDPMQRLSETSPNWLISRPSYWFSTMFQSPWATTRKISMGDFLHP